MRLASLVFVAAMVVAAQPGQGTGSLEGTVVDSVSQSPVRKAQIVLFPQFAPVQPPSARAPVHPPAAMSDAGGAFSFHNLTPGRYSLQVQHPRYPARPGPPEHGDIEVKVGESARVTLKLAPGATVSGRILDEDGDPIQGCMVQLRMANRSMFGAPGMGMQPSNEQGEYRLWGITAGKYVVAARCLRPVFQPRKFSAGPPDPPSLAYPIQFYPGAAEISGAQPIELTAGASRTGIDFSMKTARVYTVSGVMTPPSGGSLQHLGVELVNKSHRNGFDRRGGRVDPTTGAFQIHNVFPGTYALIAVTRSPNLLEPPLGGRQRLEVSDGPVQVRMSLQNAVDVTGALTVESDTSVPPKQITLQMFPEEGTGMMPPRRVEVGEDGSFVVKGMLPGPWHVVLHGPNVFLKSIELGGQSVAGNTFDLPAGTAGPLRLVVSTRTATVQGAGRPGRHYTFVQDSSDPRFASRRVATADPQGRIYVPGLPPGKYRIYEGSVSEDAPALREVTVMEAGSAIVELTSATQ